MSRLETIISMAGLNLPEKSVREQISSALDLVVHVSRMSDGTRRITTIAELVGMEGGIVSMQELFKFKREGVAEDGRVVGRFVATGIRPKQAERLQAYGIDLSESLFSNLDGIAASNGFRGDHE